MVLFLSHIIFYLIFIYVAFISTYFFFVSIAGKLSVAREYSVFDDKKRIAVFIPSYKEDQIITDTAAKALQQDYPKESFDVFVIADQLQKETIEKMKAIGVNVVEVQFETSMKAKSINQAVSSIDDRKYDIAMVLDADNLMSKGCLEKVNHAFHQGFKAVQCHRVAKNKNTSVAILDVVSEEINNNLFRRGQRALGFSSSLIGSGMAFEFEMFKKFFNLPQILNNPGEDKEIQLELMKDGIIVEFIDDAYIYDEKVSSAAVFQKQRQRWLETQFNSIKRFFDPDIRLLANRKIYWYKLFQTVLLPRSLYLLLFSFIFCCIILQHFVHTIFILPSPIWWFIIFITYFLSLIISIPAQLYNKQLLQALFSLPVLIFAMIKVILKIKPNRKEFLHTPKIHTGD